MKRFFFILLALLSSAVVSAQVHDYYFENKDAFRTFSQLKPVNDSPLVKSMPPFNVDSLLAEDKELEGLDIPFRYGYCFDVDYTLSDGKWITEGDRRIWSLRFYSKGAYSLNFIFSEMQLSPDAELYLFSTDGSMVYGPVTKYQNIEKGKFLTGLMAGDDVAIQLIEPAASEEKSKLRISRVVHAYKNTFPARDNEIVTLLSCHNNVCNYPSWKDQSDAVARVIREDGSTCSGSLLNNASQNYRPYFLTAFHCLETFDVTSWTFQFQYKSAACSPSSIYYNGSNQRAGWEDTDFLLLELQQQVFNNRITYLGWDRSSSVSSTGTGIHHPRGEMMKISFDNNTLTTNTNIIIWDSVPPNPPPPPSPAYTHWVLGFDSGTIEPGSSGSPLFNTNKRVIGQLHGVIITVPPMPQGITVA